MNKNNLNGGDIKEFQTINWLVTAIAFLVILIPLIFTLIYNFTFLGLCMLLLVLLIFCFIQYLYSNVWNIWYEGDELFFENLYKKHKKNLDLFKIIEKSGFFGYYCILYLNSGEKYYFRIKPTNNFRFFFYSEDCQIYVNKMNEKIKNYIRNQNGQTLLD